MNHKKLGSMLALAGSMCFESVLATSGSQQKTFATSTNHSEVAVKSNDKASLETLLKAAEQGEAGAQVALGFRYIIGDGVAEDAAEAVKWYSKAAAQGNAEGQARLGACYSNGWGVEKNLAEAVKWYR